MRSSPSRQLVWFLLFFLELIHFFFSRNEWLHVPGTCIVKCEVVVPQGKGARQNLTRLMANVFGGSQMNKRAPEEQRIIERMKAEIRPFIQGVLDGEARLRELDYIVFQVKWGAMSDMFNVIMGWPESLIDIITKPGGIAVELFAYLGAVETLGNTIVDIVVMLVIANGRDFHIEGKYGTPRVRHVEEISDLHGVALTAKLNFLRDNGIKTLPSMIDSNLRNDIAHLNFKFDPEKKDIFIRKKPARDVLAEGLRRLNMVFEVYDELQKIEKVMRKDLK